MSSVKVLFAIMLFVSFIGFITAQIQATFPSFQIMTGFDFAVFTVSLLGVAGTCAIVTGIPCAGAMGFFIFATFFIFSNPMLSVLFAPITVVVAYIVARLGRGGG